VDDELRLPIATDQDAHTARRAARDFASAAGFDRVGAEEVALAASELATNLVRYARGGEIRLTGIGDAARSGLQLESRDAGPGVDDLDRALRDGYSSGGGLGSGLPAVRRLADGFEISSGPAGTRVVARKWLAPASR
jgi:serine/threonine-protein kinase RsbT